jgi:peptidoglycan-N-acetylglucosamine deacetylase
LNSTHTMQPFKEPAKRTVAVTFDDLPAMNSESLTGAEIVTLTRTLTETLCSHNVPAVGFVNEIKLYRPAEVHLRSQALEMWLAAGLELGNHTFSHISLNCVSIEEWKDNVVRGETLIRSLLATKGIALRYFRHPYLDMGTDRQIRSKDREFLTERGYVIAPVTIDSVDWMYAHVYEDARGKSDAKREKQSMSDFISYTTSAIDYGERLALRTVGYEPKQILLLHANRLVAECLERILNMLRGRGYSYIPLHEALEDPIYSMPSEYFGSVGTTWINHLAYTQGILQSADITQVLPHWTIDRSNEMLPQPTLA